MARSWRALLLLGLLATAALHMAAGEEEPAAEEAAAEEAEDEDYAEAERAHLIVRKYFKEELGVQGRNLTVHLELHNAGTATASDVHLVDAETPEGLSLLEGVTEVALGKIEPSSSKEHSYVLLADKGSFVAQFKPAVVTYKPEFDSSEVQTSKSTNPAIYIMTPREQIVRYALIAGSYASLGMVTNVAGWRNLGIFALVVGLVVGGNSALLGLKSQRTQRNRTKALAELEKEDRLLRRRPRAASPGLRASCGPAVRAPR